MSATPEHALPDLLRAPAPLRLEEFFAGRCRAWGIVEDRFGILRERFQVVVRGDWDPVRCRLALTEDFVYADGRRESRIWRLDKLNDTLYRGYSDGVLGYAEIRRQGSAVRLRYRMRVPIAGQSLSLVFDDRMYRQDDGLILNRVALRKFGLLLATITICFQREAGGGRAGA